MKLSKDELIHGFRVLRTDKIREIQSDAYIMEHVKSGARLMYLDTEDDNKVFSICFRTPPDNSKGAPHIMEHSTLCGSDAFPLKDPFVELVKGSLNTFLNAITWPDKTMYPVASRNTADFHNLMHVYLDAVFFPCCLKDHQIMMQEGWHYELESENGPLTYKGVVYNEMKGALSAPDAVLEDKVMSELFPDTTYGMESGGDPEVIPSLTFKEFTDFHRRFYHPSNSYIYIYGDMDIDQTLKFIDESYLCRFDRHPTDSEIMTQSPFEKRRIFTEPYGIANGESETGKAIHSIDIALNDHMTAVDSLGFRILNYALIEMEGAPLKKAVIDAGIGSDISGNYCDSFKQPVWSIDVAGSEPEKQKEFAAVFDSEIRSLVLNGIERDILEAALNRTEFILRENDYHGRPKGLFYGVRAMDFWLYGRDPFELLRYEDGLKYIRENLDHKFFENLLLRYVLKNSHQVLVTLTAQKGLNEKKNAAVADRLEKFRKSLSPEQLNQIIQDTRELKQRQGTPDTPEQLASIPLLTRNDLKKTIIDDKMLEEDVENVRLYHCPQDTNGISYINLYFTLYGLEAEDLCYARLLANLLGAMDTEKYTYSELSRRSNAQTGGITFNVSAFGSKDDDTSYIPVMTVKGKALTSRVAALTDLLGQMCGHTAFSDVQRLKELLKEEKSGWDMSVFARGHELIMTRLLSYFSPIEKFREQSGLTYYYFLSKLVKGFDSSSGEIMERLQSVAGRIFTRANLFMQFIGTDADKTSAMNDLKALTGTLEAGKPDKVLKYHFPPAAINEGILSSGKVQYVAQGGNFRKHGFSYTGALQVMETILRYEYLWRKVRVQGGAYGAFTRFLLNGNGLLCSYRDPNLAETLEVYKGLPEYLRTFDVSEREMTKYVIGTMAPAETQYTAAMKGDRAMLHHLCGITHEDRMKIRQEIIGCSAQDIRDLADLVEAMMKDPYICVMGNEGKVRDNEGLFGRIISLPE